MHIKILTKLLVAGASAVAIGGLAPTAASASQCADADIVPTRQASETRSTNYKYVPAGWRAKEAVVCLTNEIRVGRGLPPLERRDTLNSAAFRHSRDMVLRMYFSHYSPEGNGPVDRARETWYCSTSCFVGENISWGTGSFSTPRDVVRRWMESPGHRDNILNRSYTTIGVGVSFWAPNSYGGQAATYTQMLGG